MSTILDPITIAGTDFKNRLVMSPMCQYSAIDGFANSWHQVHYGTRAVGGVALIMQEATAVCPEGRISYADLGIWSDAHAAALKPIVDFAHAQNTKIGIQLAHAGRKASLELPWKGGRQIAPDATNGWQTLSASDQAYYENENPPLPLDDAGINKVISDYVDAAIRARDIGYDVIEIHGAHGYLFHQFYSPQSNSRTDAYGGSFENRIRLLVEVTRAVKSVWRNKPLFVRISATDWVDGLWDINDSVALCKVLKEIGVHLIDVSSGANVPHVKIPAEPNYQVSFAEAIKRDAEILTGAVGLITNREQADAILEEGRADMVFMARELLRNPYFMLQQSGADWPNQYVRSK